MKNKFKILAIYSISLIFLFSIPKLSLGQIAGIKDISKINGMSFLGPGEPGLNSNVFHEIKGTHSNWIALIPESILDRETLSLKPDNTNPKWGETVESQIKSIQLAKQTGLKVMLKPHIVLEKKEVRSKSIDLNLYNALLKENDDKTYGAEWRGDFKAINESDWRIWERSYEQYILKLAKIAEAYNVELFCIGTELRESIVIRPQFWKQLIYKVRRIYNGALTYSANWDEYDKVTFWSDLDFIGIDSYFPINWSKTPSVYSTLKNWQPIKDKLKNLSQKENRKILITEYGYRNIHFAGAEPWLHDKGGKASNYKAQMNLYKAFYQTFWKEDWIAGGFSWNWLHAPQKGMNTDFSIQNKPALDVLKKWYSLEYN